MMLASAPPLGPDPRFQCPPVETTILANGLRVMTMRYDGAPLIAFGLQMDGGSAADPPGKEGLAACVADLLDEDIDGHDAMHVTEALASIGAEYEVDVTSDVTNLSLTTLTRFAERGAALLAAMATAPHLSRDAFDRVRQMRAERLGQLKRIGIAVVEATLLRALYDGESYAHPPLGTTAGIRSLSFDDATAFHGRVYRPSMATLVVVGAMAHPELLRLADDAFGRWTVDGALPASPKPGDQSPRAATQGIRLVTVEDLTQTELRIGVLTASRASPDYHALLVMNGVLGGEAGSRLSLRLREQGAYTYAARTGFDWSRRSAVFALRASVDPRSTAAAIRASIEEMAAMWNERPATDAETAMARAMLVSAYLRGFERIQKVASGLLQLAALRLSSADAECFVDRIRAVTADDVTEVARRYLRPEKLMTVAAVSPVFVDAVRAHLPEAETVTSDL